MKEYIVEIDDETAAFYGKIAMFTGRKTEEILEDTLFKVMDMLGENLKGLWPDNRP